MKIQIVSLQDISIILTKKYDIYDNQEKKISFSEFLKMKFSQVQQLLNKKYYYNTTTKL